MAKVALITGGAKGIGRAIGLDLAAAGWDVAFCYRTSETEAAETAALIMKAGRRAMAERCDVSDAAAAGPLIHSEGADRVADRTCPAHAHTAKIRFIAAQLNDATAECSSFEDFHLTGVSEELEREKDPAALTQHVRNVFAGMHAQRLAAEVRVAIEAHPVAIHPPHLVATVEIPAIGVGIARVSIPPVPIPPIGTPSPVLSIARVLHSDATQLRIAEAAACNLLQHEALIGVVVAVINLNTDSLAIGTVRNIQRLAESGDNEHGFARAIEAPMLVRIITIGAVHRRAIAVLIEFQSAARGRVADEKDVRPRLLQVPKLRRAVASRGLR